MRCTDTKTLGACVCSYFAVFTVLAGGCCPKVLLLSNSKEHKRAIMNMCSEKSAATSSARRMHYVRDTLLNICGKVSRGQINSRNIEIKAFCEKAGNALDEMDAVLKAKKQVCKSARNLSLGMDFDGDGIPEDINPEDVKTFVFQVLACCNGFTKFCSSDGYGNKLKKAFGKALQQCRKLHKKAATKRQRNQDLDQRQQISQTERNSHLRRTQ